MIVHDILNVSRYYATMRNRLLITSLFCILGACATQPTFDAVPNFNNRHPNGPDQQTIIFVGERIGLESIPYEEWCPESHVCLDQRLNARYRIVELLKGDYDASIIDFAVYDHGAIDPFWNHENIVLYVAQIGEHLVHHKYQYDILSPLKGQGFAFCGDPYAEYEEHQIEDFGREALTRYSFSPPIRIELADFHPSEEDEQDAELQEYVRERFVDGMRSVAPPAFKIENGIATCRMGVSAQELAQIRMYYEYSEDAKEYWATR